MLDANGRRINGATVVIESGIPEAAAQAGLTAITTALFQAIAQSLHLAINTVDKAVLIHRAQNLFSPSDGHAVDALTALCPGRPARPLAALQHAAQ